MAGTSSTCSCRFDDAGIAMPGLLEGIHLSRLGVPAVCARDGVLLNTHLAEHWVGIHAHDVKHSAAKRARGLTYGRPTFECCNSCFKISDATGKSHQAPPAGNCVQKFQHV